MKLPRYFSHDGRPVKVIATPDGGMTCLAFDRTKGEFERDLWYLSELLFNPGTSSSVQELNEEEFVRLVADLRAKG